MFSTRQGRDVIRKKKSRKQVLLSMALGTIFLVLVTVYWLTSGATGETPESVQPVASEPQTQPELEQQEGIEQKEPPKEPPKEEFDPYSVKIPRVVVKTSENEDPEVRRKREAIRNAFIHAYGGYEKHCMGQGELHPITGKCNNWLVANMGLSIMDSLDTMLIMGLDEFYKNGRDYLAKNLNWNQTINVSVFETNIRCLGGLLSAYALTKDPVLLQKSIELGDHLLAAFDSPTGYPYTWINLQTREKTLSTWTGGSVILSELGTMQLEFWYLSHVSNDPIYADTALRVFERLHSNMPQDKLYPLMINIQNGEYTSDMVGIGALADSFYEYILKIWLISKQTNDIIGTWYFEVAEAIIDRLGIWVDDTNFLIGERQYGQLNWKMDHLACFAGAMFGLGAQHAPTPAILQKHMKHAIGVGNFCRKMYTMTPTGLPCDAVKVNEKTRVISPSDLNNGVYYQMRPEAVETWFYLYRLTNDTKYQDWGWEFFQAVEKYTKTKLGYTGIRDATDKPENLQPDDKQQSFFLAETLKYLYLLFSPHEYISLNEFIFNTEAHPFPISSKR